MRAERALTRPWVELQAAKLQNVPQSPNGTVLISGVSRVSRVWPIGMRFSSLGPPRCGSGFLPPWYPGLRRCLLRSHRLALGSHRTVPLGLRASIVSGGGACPGLLLRSVFAGAVGVFGPLGSCLYRRTSAVSGRLRPAKNQMRLWTPGGRTRRARTRERTRQNELCSRTNSASLLSGERTLPPFWIGRRGTSLPVLPERKQSRFRSFLS